MPTRGEEEEEEEDDDDDTSLPWCNGAT